MSQNSPFPQRCRGYQRTPEGSKTPCALFGSTETHNEVRRPSAFVESGRGLELTYLLGTAGESIVAREQPSRLDGACALAPKVYRRPKVYIKVYMAIRGHEKTPSDEARGSGLSSDLGGGGRIRTCVRLPSDGFTDRCH